MKTATKQKQVLKSQKAGRQNQNGIVGVNGSIPLASTKLKIPKNIKLIEIPSDWEVIPAIRWENGSPYLYQVLRKSDAKRFENDLNGKRRKKAA